MQAKNVPTKKDEPPQQQKPKPQPSLRQVNRFHLIEIFLKENMYHLITDIV